MNFILSKSTLQRPLASALLALSMAASSTLVAQNIDLAELGTTHPGFVINGIDSNDQSGLSVSGAEDVNGDGIGDLLESTASRARHGSQSAIRCFRLY